jgi:hypothetical protein
VLACQRNCLSPSSSLPDHRHVWLRTDDTQKSDTHYRVVVGDQHSNDTGFESFSNQDGGLGAMT